jgi:hypothetical protein
VIENYPVRYDDDDDDALLPMISRIWEDVQARSNMPRTGSSTTAKHNNNTQLLHNNKHI